MCKRKVFISASEYEERLSFWEGVFASALPPDAKLILTDYDAMSAEYICYYESAAWADDKFPGIEVFAVIVRRGDDEMILSAEVVERFSRVELSEEDRESIVNYQRGDKSALTICSTFVDASRFFNDED